MPAPGRKNLLARRRRRQDDGEEDESVLGDLEDDSLSEGSGVSNGDDEAENEGSDSGTDDHEPAKPSDTAVVAGSASDRPDSRPVASGGTEAKPNGVLNASTGTDTASHRGEPGQTMGETQGAQVEDLSAAVDAVDHSVEVVAPKAPRSETPAQRSRREHQEYIRQRNADPAFVPNRGNFFLHDNRTSLPNGHSAKPFARGRGRGFIPTVSLGFNEPTERPWAHDLHEDHETPSGPVYAPGKPMSTVSEAAKAPPTAAPASAPPNRSFSFTTTLGNVNVQILLPGMDRKIIRSNVVKKHYTLLPQHRPPLRRDKPVRVSVPNAAPRYIFPSTDRSFIFIPRALRPNQQGYARGRGRGSFQGSRRPSIYGSVYTPSVAMSRRSSVGASTLRDGIISPAESVISRTVLPGHEGARPIVRMPSAVPTPSLSRTGLPIMNGPIGMVTPVTMQMPPGTVYAPYPNAIPIHQPRPQKTVSVADIESPARFEFRAPQQQQEQPFHQQVPAHMSTNPYATDEKAPQGGQPAVPGSGSAGVTPLSQIPEGAVFTPGFASYPAMTAPPYFAAPYPNGPVFYPHISEGGGFPASMNGPALAPSFVPGSQSHPVGFMHPPVLVDGGLPTNLMAHESNGMVYYSNFNPTMFPGDTPSAMQHFPAVANGNIVPHAMPAPPPPIFYSSMPAGMFYPAQSS